MLAIGKEFERRMRHGYNREDKTPKEKEEEGGVGEGE